MKKLILAMVFVFATGTMMNANTSNEHFGCAGECVSDSKHAAIAMTEDGGDLVDTYMAFYTSCYDARCR
jgi:hypothetical protein